MLNAYGCVQLTCVTAYMQDRGLGFCLFSNVALTALHAKQQHGVKRIAILDWVCWLT